MVTLAWFQPFPWFPDRCHTAPVLCRSGVTVFSSRVPMVLPYMQYQKETQEDGEFQSMVGDTRKAFLRGAPVGGEASMYM